jgi:hypothetical protein
MKFDFVIGNPPYQETKEKTKTQTQANSSWIYQYFQIEADKISKCSCLIYPFGGWFDSPDSLNGLGNIILKDKHTISIRAFEGTNDKRAWYRTDKLPKPIFGNNANLSAGVSIVIRDRNFHDTIKYSNRVYSDEIVSIDSDSLDDLTPNPVFIKINKKLFGEKLTKQIKKGVFGIESNFVETNPDKVSKNSNDWNHPITLLANDKSGSSGRATYYKTDISSIPRGHEYIPLYKVVITSAYPKKSIVSGIPTIDNVKNRLKLLIEVMEPNSAFGMSRLSLFMSKTKEECNNFIKYTQTNFFAGLTLQEPNRRSSFGLVIPTQNFSNNSDIDWNKSLEEIDKQLYKKYNLNDDDISFIENRGGNEYVNS